MDANDIEKDSKNPEGMGDESVCRSLGVESPVLSDGLYLVATPIGNLRDISLRALDVLRAVDVILCEDTRVTRKLLNAYGIKSHLRSYNDHSDAMRRDSILSQIQEGQAVALVSDAGMPLISDPGYKLVRDCREAGVYVTSIPGACAPLAALQLSGLPSDRFCFLGFLPHKTKARQDVMAQWRDVPATLLFFETAPRLLAALKDMGAVFGGREIAVVREITKFYEEVRKGCFADLLLYYEEYGAPKGEMVVVVAPPDDVVFDDAVVAEMMRGALKVMKTKDAAGFVAEKTGLKKNDLYDLALKLGREG